MTSRQAKGCVHTDLLAAQCQAKWRVVTASFSLLIEGIDKIYFHLVRHCFSQKFLELQTFETSDPLSNLIEVSQSPPIQRNGYGRQSKIPE